MTPAPPASQHSSTLGQGLPPPRRKLSFETQRWLRPKATSERGRGSITGTYTGSTSEAALIDPLEGVGFLRAESEPELTVWNGRVGESY